jgi:hypothetical protein
MVHLVVSVVMLLNSARSPLASRRCSESSLCARPCGRACQRAAHCMYAVLIAMMGKTFDSVWEGQQKVSCFIFAVRPTWLHPTLMLLSAAASRPPPPPLSDAATRLSRTKSRAGDRSTLCRRRSRCSRCHIACSNGAGRALLLLLTARGWRPASSASMKIPWLSPGTWSPKSSAAVRGLASIPGLGPLVIRPQRPPARITSAHRQVPNGPSHPWLDGLAG